jgi:hypothetical protein
MSFLSVSLYLLQLATALPARMLLFDHGMLTLSSPKATPDASEPEVPETPELPAHAPPIESPAPSHDVPSYTAGIESTIAGSVDIPADTKYEHATAKPSASSTKSALPVRTVTVDNSGAHCEL